ncbi:hypothetical protein AB0H57_32560 [Micromonospora sp. NPDC050686]|uniref:hypothetical protein n=1 Tax=Micromonospora sp. NPDC050686 TaxID=3154631 RepID=UPI0034022EFC
MRFSYIRGVVVAGLLGLAVFNLPAAANADSGGWCGHSGYGSHWHGLTYNSFNYYSGWSYYTGNGRYTHYHDVINSYVSTFGQQWTDHDTNTCPVH